MLSLDAVSIEDIGRACGIKRVRTIDPYQLDDTREAIKEELAATDPSLIVSRAPCPLKERRKVGAMRTILAEECRSCELCLSLGCPAIEGVDGVMRINQALCAGCGLCEQLCPAGAIVSREGA